MKLRMNGQKSEKNMNEKEYDQIINQHYRHVAQKEGLKPTSTMADTVTREKETQVILDYSTHFLASRQWESSPVFIDVGCGNGYTLEVLAARFPEAQLLGIEKSDDLRTLAESRFQENDKINIITGDIRDGNFAAGTKADILVCQRVLINLLDPLDQKNALENLIATVKAPVGGRDGGMLLFIEAFSASLSNLNIAREEFDISPMEPAHHNLYLPEGFFKHPKLVPYPSAPELAPANFLSTHYFVTRVLHPIFLQDRPFKRNSEFVKFFTQALKENVGDYAPVKLFAFTRS